MDDYGLPGVPSLPAPNSPYGLRGRGVFEDPYMLRGPSAFIQPPAPLPYAPAPDPTIPVPPLRPGPLAAAPAPYVGGSGVPRSRAAIQPGMDILQGMSNRAPNVVPLRTDVPFGEAAAEAFRVQRQRTPSGTDSGLPQLTQQQMTNLMRRKESSGNYQAQNKTTSASGAYQNTDANWNGYGGYAHAFQAPAWLQDKKFAEDVSKSMAKYGNDPYRVIASHNLPAFANRPELWTKRLRVKPSSNSKKLVEVPPLEEYIRYIIKGTELEDGFDEYLKRHSAR